MFYLVSSCNIANPVYTVIIADDVYKNKSSFTNESNPFISVKNQRAHLFELISESSKCFIKYVKNLSTSDPKVSLYSVSETENGEVKAYVYAFRGTTANYNDILNDIQIAQGKVTDFAKKVKDEIKSHVSKYSNTAIYFVGHSLGAKLAHSLGYLMDVPSFGLDSPGMASLANSLQSYFNLNKSYEDYHKMKVHDIFGLPNAVNYTLGHIEKHQTVLVSDADVPCSMFSIFGLSPIIPLDKLLYNMQWTYAFHNTEDMIATLIRNKNNLSDVFIYHTDLSLYPIMSNPKTAKVIRKMHDCVPSIFGFKKSYINFEKDLLSYLKGK